MADALALGASGVTHGGSSPLSGTLDKPYILGIIYNRRRINRQEQPTKLSELLESMRKKRKDPYLIGKIEEGEVILHNNQGDLRIIFQSGTCSFDVRITRLDAKASIIPNQRVVNRGSLGGLIILPIQQLRKSTRKNSFFEQGSYLLAVKKVGAGFTMKKEFLLSDKMAKTLNEKIERVRLLREAATPIDTLKASKSEDKIIPLPTSLPATDLIGSHKTIIERFKRATTEAAAVL